MRRTPHGQGMLELIIAVGIIMVSVTSTIGLVFTTLRSSAVSKSQILAINLAREGIEVARNIRDSNWLAVDSGVPDAAWNNGLFLTETEGDDFTAVPVFDVATGDWSLSFTPDNDSFGTPSTQVFQDQSSPPGPTHGLFLQTGGGAVAEGFKQVQYWRFVSLMPICWIDTGGTPSAAEERIVTGDHEVCDPGYVQVGIEARAKVRWLEGGIPHNVDQVEKLFNWKA